MAREIAYQTGGEGGFTKHLKDKKKAIWPQFPLARGAFSLFDVGHAFTEVKNITCLQLFKFSGSLPRFMMVSFIRKGNLSTILTFLNFN